MRKRRPRSQIDANLLLAPMVIWLRMPLLIGEAAQAGIGGVEGARAVGEKLEAAVEGIFAAQLSIWSSAINFWPSVVVGTAPSTLIARSFEDFTQAVVAPSGRRVRANYLRLVKTVQ